MELREFSKHTFYIYTKYRTHSTLLFHCNKLIFAVSYVELVFDDAECVAPLFDFVCVPSSKSYLLGRKQAYDCDTNEPGDSYAD